MAVLSVGVSGSTMISGEVGGSMLGMVVVLFASPMSPPPTGMLIASPRTSIHEVELFRTNAYSLYSFVFQLSSIGSLDGHLPVTGS